ncbi:MAG: alpha-ketoglutarate-dependent dioxygenase AlkB [Actinomycetota bacterium]|nr:alpha-ketoglutarate-dependent dioxygenase AlkB [Actinomycetota bacterium]
MSDPQPSLDLAIGEDASSAIALDLPDADITLLPLFLRRDDADRLLTEVADTTPWRQELITLYGRQSPVPRLTAWHGDPQAVYTYSNIAMEPEPWSAPLLEIRALVEAEAATRFNSVLCNLYRHGRDSVAWHSDDEAELGPRPVIASVSLGDTRTFQLRHRTRSELRHQIELSHGCLLLMRGATQRHWKHQISKTARPVGRRINLTYRTVLTGGPDHRLCM